MKASTIFLIVLALCVISGLVIVWYLTGNSTLFLGVIIILCAGMWMWYDPQFDTKERLEADYQLRRWKEMVQELHIGDNNVSHDFLVTLEAKLLNLEDRISKIENSTINNINTNVVNDTSLLEFSEVICKVLKSWDSLDPMKRSMLIFQLEKLNTNSLLLKESINIFKNV